MTESTPSHKIWPDHQPQNEREPQTPTRREFLWQLGAFAGLLGLMGGRDIFRGAEAHAAGHEPTAEETREQQEYQKLLESFERQLQEFGELNTDVSIEQAQNILEQCSFLPRSVPASEFTILEPYVPFQEGQEDPLEKSLREASERGEFTVGELQILAINYEDANIHGASVFYATKHNAIFINQHERQSDRERLEGVLCSTAARDGYAEECAALREQLEQTQDRELYFQQMDEVEARYRRIQESIKSIRDIPPAVLIRYADRLQTELDQIREVMIGKDIMTELALPHEAFHYFFDEHMFREDYEGPSQDTWLTMAIKKIKERSPDKQYGHTAYADISYYIEQLFGRRELTDNEINTFALWVSQNHDLTEQVQDDDPRGHDYVVRHRALSKFLNEYIARIYNGALGNTDEKFVTRMDEELGRIGLKRFPHKKDVQFHTPDQDELTFLQMSKFNGERLIPL